MPQGPHRAIVLLSRHFLHVLNCGQRGVSTRFHTGPACREPGCQPVRHSSFLGQAETGVKLRSLRNYNPGKRSGAPTIVFKNGGFEESPSSRKETHDGQAGKIPFVPTGLRSSLSGRKLPHGERKDYGNGSERVAALVPGCQERFSVGAPQVPLFAYRKCPLSPKALPPASFSSFNLASQHPLPAWPLEKRVLLFPSRLGKEDPSCPFLLTPVLFLGWFCRRADLQASVELREINSGLCSLFGSTECTGAFRQFKYLAFSILIQPPHSRPSPEMFCKVGHEPSCCNPY
ncbi:hypothetical protein L345_00104, partial [Ophiophagus hannah]